MAPQSPAASLSLLAGSTGGPGFTDGDAVTARFSSLLAIASDAQGNIVVSDDSVLRAVTQTGTVTTLGSNDGTTPQRDYQSAIRVAIAGDGALWVSDGKGVHRRAGANNSLAFAADPLDMSRKFYPIGADANGNGYVADSYHCVLWKVTPALVASVLGGLADDCRAIDGALDQARFGRIFALASDRHGSIYVADETGNEWDEPPEPVVQRLRKIAADGTVTTLVEDPGTGGRFTWIDTITADGKGNAYVLDARGIVRVDGAGNDTVLPIPADVPYPRRFTADEAGNIYFTTDGGAIYKVPAGTGNASRLVGQPAEGGTIDGTGAEARFSSVAPTALDTNGDVLVASWEIFGAKAGLTTRRVTSVGKVTTEFVAPTGAPASAVSYPNGYAFDAVRRIHYFSEGSHCISDSVCLPGHAIWRMTASGSLSKFADLENAPVTGPVIDGQGNLYVADGNALRKITPTGALSTVVQAIAPANVAVRALAVDAEGTAYAFSNDWVLRKISPDGQVTFMAGAANQPGWVDGKGAAARLQGPQVLANSMAVDPEGNVYMPAAAVADASVYLGPDTPGAVRKVSPDGTVTTIAGQLGRAGIQLGPLPGILYAPSSMLWTPDGLVVGSGLALLKIRQ
ncbi:hypothetical protein [Ramlibacter sp. PS4R-6]|uniref:hypothetical protein n=1 Tax=Ramlibacter sp. PS4R-6 TaxID=3133438 RepID=UPI00309F2283